MRYDFTEGLQSALRRARTVAASFKSPEVTTVHLLLSILDEPEGAVAAALSQVTDTREMRKRLQAFGLGEATRGRTSTGVDLPFTSGAKHALESAMIATRRHGQAQVGVPHLLAGLLTPRLIDRLPWVGARDSQARVVLEGAGVRLNITRQWLRDPAQAVPRATA
jgi:ATP-dependent Clp protease ATP-binding subunit ClpA